MAESNKNKHLTHEERKIIEFGIRSGATQKAIADTIGKQKSTVGIQIESDYFQHQFCSQKTTSWKISNRIDEVSGT